MLNRWIGSALTLGFVMVTVPLLAQGPNVPPTLSTGREPYGSYWSGSRESVNRYNGNVNVSIL